MYFICALLVSIFFPTVESSCLDNNIFDYIVVGSGSSGAVVATRLSEDPSNRVLLLEAGGKPSALSEIPLISFKALNTEMDWQYWSVPQKHCCRAMKNKAVEVNRGKALGGTSSLNYMIYTRGNKLDFDLWEKLGNPGWDYQSVLPYFLKLEDYQVPRTRDEDIYHNEGGPITVSIPTFKTPLADAFLQAGYELGQNVVDYNGKYQTGFMYPPVTLRDGKRCGTYEGYLKPALKRSNLDIVTKALVTKLLIDGEKRVTGVLYERESSKCTAKAVNEVIVSAGVINTPQLLMLSGIGPSEVLRKFDIPVVVDLPGVGKNLQDHLALGGIMYYLNQTVSYNSERFETQRYLDLWKKTRLGPMTCPEGYEGVAFYETKYANVSDWPDIEIFYNSGNTLRMLKHLLNPIFALNSPDDKKDVISFHPLLLRPKSRGIVTLASNDPHDPPLIDPKYLSHPDDVNVLVEGMKFAWAIGDSKPFQKYGADFVNKEISVTCLSFILNSDEYNKCLVSLLSLSGFHPTSSCKMGPKSDPLAVVDNRLRVYGVKSLRIADASIMPTIVSAHPNAACIMIGEKVSDMIKEDNRRDRRWHWLRNL